MQLIHTKAAFTALWLVIVILAASFGNLASISSWAILALFAAIPPVVFWQLWSAPVPSMSENIRRAMKE